MFQARVDGQFGSGLEQVGGLGHLCGKLLVVGHRQQIAVFVAHQEGVQAGLVGQIGSLEFLLGHVGRIKIGAQRFRADAFDERRIAAEAIPGAVIDLREAARGLVFDTAQQRFLVAIGFVPKTFVHQLGGLDQQGDHLLFVVAQLAQVGRQPHGGVFREQGVHFRQAGLFAGIGAFLRLAAAIQGQGQQHGRDD